MEMSSFAETIMRQKYAQPGEEWPDISARVAREVVGPYLPHLVGDLTEAITARKFMPAGRYLYAAGRPRHPINNCILLRPEDSREGWASLMSKVTAGLMMGGGVGTVYSDLRSRGSLVRGMGGISTGPTALMQMVNEAGRHIMQGGSRRSALWAGLHWNHPDVMEFISMKEWPVAIQIMKEQDFNAVAPMDGTNISVILDTAFFRSYAAGDSWAHEVYWKAVELMLRTGEPGFSIDINENEGENLRNPCTEVTSYDDNDICNLGSLNLARIESRDELKSLVELATAFLLCGTLYSDVPFPEVQVTREKNRRIGLGLMGIYEWLVSRGKPYEPDGELASWLRTYEEDSDICAGYYADRLNISRPVKKRAIAPTGTIGILAETTTGIEPLFAHAYKRRYLRGNQWHYQYVVDATAQRLMDKGIPADKLPTAYDLASTPGKRLNMQAWVQNYVDHGISSTLNLPAFDEQVIGVEEFGHTLMDSLPSLRGVTAYPNGARGGQPLNVVPYEEASQNVGVEYDEVGSEHACVDGVCGV